MARSRVSDPAQLTFLGVMSGEWLKLRTQRGFVWATALGVVASAGFSALGGYLLRTEWNNSASSVVSLAASMPTTGVLVASQLVGLGLCIWLAGEFVSGSNYLTLLAVPRRSLVFSARALLVILVGVITGCTVALFGAVSALVVVGPDVMAEVLSSGDFWVNVWLALAVSVSMVLLFFAAAVVARRSLPAVGIVAALLYLLPTIEGTASIFGMSLLPRVLQWFPGSLVSGALAAQSGASTSAPSPLVASVLLILWCLLFVAGAAWGFARYE